jgi:D-serine deaminase-like pyridoxal phosphate-dependent protein
MKNVELPLLDTPALLIDLDVVHNNLRRMQELADGHGVALRPHIKTHKIPELALLQVQFGANGIAVAKLSEAEVMADAGIKNLFVANQLVTEEKIERLLALAGTSQVCVGLDSLTGAEKLSRVFRAAGQSIDYLIEIDTGLNRCGVSPGEPAVQLFQQVDNLPGIRFKGIFTHAGQVYGSDSLDQVREISRLESTLMAKTWRAFQDASVSPQVVSVGSTPTMKVWQGHEAISEIRPGNYIFNDAMQVALGVAQPEDCALSVLATVISRPATKRAVIDAGSKVFGLDKGVHGKEMVRGFGMVLGKQAVLKRLSEEHGIMALEPDENLHIGDRVRLIPNHACTVVNLFDRSYGLRKGEIVQEFKIAARGKVQ